ncbi:MULTISPECIES: nucleotide exchange factor GrpE [Bacillaceae]|uniref:nucleotide exchange factor GrpE n=1 Tax=Bacillaceae TaxID=186817 RepID=UPI001BE8D783|nr:MULTISPECIES: nucleotide exchange factor GrpE [Bacillaceae]MBT2616840.1 nucleotide exchange factor GrpE [Bacillus sp. ISL-78]MBT2631558.1 nucleotide exchange factor GrpE [Bacillus sp. ISL-101]MBT2718230.1 nucleotide exchange factor GrpE [Bacillus sp. ISL-57]MEB2490496.1 nucleotide exchange factor GrpE [Peribacillus frigoritolerans]MED3759009.1 nucleotide exchange factor GrpE [Peribacillus frigoritolerans]
MTENKNEEQTLENETIEESAAEAVFAEEEIPAAEENDSPVEKDELQLAQEKIAELEAKIEEMDNRYLRLQADFDNSRRRAKLDMEAAQKYRVQSIASDLVEALDNFERATKIEAENEQTKSLLSGMEMVYKAITGALAKEGIEPISSVGEEFDPRLHQAVMQVQDENFGSNIVVEEFQKGYLLKDRVIRPAMVKVNE